MRRVLLSVFAVYFLLVNSLLYVGCSGEEYQLRVSVDTPGHLGGGGKVTRDPPSGTYRQGSEVTLTAVPNPGWRFSAWGGDITGDANPVVLRMDSSRQVQAIFSPAFDVVIDVVGGGRASASYDPNGENVTLHADPDGDWLFSGWSGDIVGDASPLSFRLDSNKHVTATFGKKRTLRVSSLGKADVSIEEGGSRPMALSWGAASTLDEYDYVYSLDFPDGKALTISANPAAGWEFDNWIGDIVSDCQTIWLTMDSDKTITAACSWPASRPFFPVANGVGVPEAAPYAAGNDIHPVMLVSLSGNSYLWSDNALPTDWVAATVAETQLVVCVGEEETKTLEVCPYVNASSITRYQYYMDLELREAKTGRIVAKTTLYGSMPRGCKEREDLGLTELCGTHICFDQLKTWLQPYVAPSLSVNRIGRVVGAVLVLDAACGGPSITVELDDGTRVHVCWNLPGSPEGAGYVEITPTVGPELWKVVRIVQNGSMS